MAPQPTQKPAEKPQENAEAQAPKKSTLDSFLEFALNSRDWFEKSWTKLQNIEKSNIELGVYHLRAGRFFDAAIRFKIATIFNKNSSIAWYLLGKARFYEGKRNKAVIPLRNALRLNPQLDEAVFLLNGCGSREKLTAIPRSFIIEKLDIMANNYEAYLSDIGNLIISAFSELISKYLGEKSGINTLDLNCRGGELGTLVKNKTNNMIGVEPSIKLAGLARTKRDNNLLVFNYVQSKFPEDYLKTATDKFDLAICALYFDNLGDIEPILNQIHNVLNPKGALVFNINKTNAADFEFMQNSLIFGHSDAYIRKVTDKVGFKIISTKEIQYAGSSTDIVYLVEKK